MSAMADRGLLTVAVWALLNIAIAAFITFVVQARIDKLGLLTIFVLNAIIVLRSAPYWPRSMQKREPPDDDT